MTQENRTKLVDYTISFAKAKATVQALYAPDQRDNPYRRYSVNAMYQKELARAWRQYCAERIATLREGNSNEN